MPRYRVRLEDPNSEHFRITYINADSPEEAAAKVQAVDADLVAFRLTDEQLNDQDNPPSKGQIAVHEQTEPYVLAYVVERGDQKALDKARATISQRGGDE